MAITYVSSWPTYWLSMIGSPGSTTRTSPSVSPQLASLLAGMLPITSTTSFPPVVVLQIASLAFFVVAYRHQEPLLNRAVLGSEMFAQ
jgi:hypothetical protein